jgi:TPR repeat protein
MPARIARRFLSRVVAAGGCIALAVAGGLALAAAASEDTADGGGAALLARAEAGEAAAQLALALSLESEGARDEAADWYARAAARGEGRAQYFLGQLYETGTGVPRAPDRARAWYAAAEAGVPAAAERLDGIAVTVGPADPVAPELRIAATTEGGQSLDVVWTSRTQPIGALFHVSAFASGQSPAPVATAATPLTAVVLPVPQDVELCCVRVLAVDPVAQRYAASDWIAFAAQVPPWTGAEVVFLPAGADGDVASAIAAEAADDLAAAGILARVADAAQDTAASCVRYHYAEDRALAEAVAAMLPGSIPVERAPPGAGASAQPGRIEVRLVARDAAIADP